MKTAILLEDLLEFIQTLNQQTDFSEILRITAHRIAVMMDADRCTVLMVNPVTGHTLKTICCQGVADERRHVVQNQIAGWLLLNAQPLFSKDITHDQRFRGVNFRDARAQAVMGAPLMLGGQAVGAVILMNEPERISFAAEDSESLVRLATVIAPYLKNIQELQTLFQTPPDEKTLFAKYRPFGLLGKSKKLLELLQSVEAAAACDVRVLLEGKSGTGKELVACAIHKLSRRRDRPFIAVDCGAIPANLMESELFGHERGAFTGAERQRKGLFEEANKGTIFIDEISSLPLDMQAKLMRVLQEHEVRPVGSNTVRKVDVRIITASSRPLKKMMEEGRFRDDLYYRLYVYPIHVPTLEERQEDIPLLAQHFMVKFAAEQGKTITAIDGDLISYLRHKPWPGQVRELENFIERLVTQTPAGITELHVRQLPAEHLKEYRRLEKSGTLPTVTASLKEQMDEYERAILEETLAKYSGNQSRTARALKISEQALRYKMIKLGLK